MSVSHDMVVEVTSHYLGSHPTVLVYPRPTLHSLIAITLSPQFLEGNDLSYLFLPSLPISNNVVSLNQRNSWQLVVNSGKFSSLPGLTSDLVNQSFTKVSGHIQGPSTTTTKQLRSTKKQLPKLITPDPVPNNKLTP